VADFPKHAFVQKVIVKGRGGAFHKPVHQPIEHLLYDPPGNKCQECRYHE
jgi:hypothetical protein